MQIVPLFYLDNTIEKVEGMRPYTPLELAGRDIYVREGCYVCHSQMIRPMRDEVDRYGHYSLAAEVDVRPPLPVGLEAHRAGPCPRRRPLLRRLARRAHDDPRDIVPESIMPAYPFLAATPIERRPHRRDHGGATAPWACPTPTR